MQSIILLVNGIPYFYILSKNFLKDNQSCYPIDDSSFFHSKLVPDENNNITHKQIIASIIEGVKENYGSQISEENLIILCNKLGLQYATQEVIKKLIKSIDENLGNTSLVVTDNENGNVLDMNISPAYDLDLSFSLGEEILSIDYTNNNFYRTGSNGGTELVDLLKDFKDIPGFSEKMSGIYSKFQGNYVEHILENAYSRSKIGKLQEPALKDKYANFLMRQVVCFKDAYQMVFQQERDDREI